MNVAIIVAAGAGTRFGGATPKQFLEIHGKPLLIHTLERFEACRTIDEIVLVLPAAEIENFRRILDGFSFAKIHRIAAGGETRHASVLNGLRAMKGREIEIVAVHDGARPLVTAEEITRTVETARTAGAACLVAPVTDTIKRIADGKIVETIDRSELRRALTPQCFRRDVLERAFAVNDSATAAATDECFLVERIGCAIAVVEGSARNIKITTIEDFVLAESLLKETPI